MALHSDAVVRTALLVNIPKRQARRTRRQRERDGAANPLRRARDHDNVVLSKPGHCTVIPPAPTPAA